MQEEIEKIQLLSKWCKKGFAPPYSISLQVTELCNLKCLFCMRGTKIRVKELPTSRLIELVKQAGEMGVKKINISGGGEPFFNSRKMLEVARVIKKYGMNGGTNTNGILLDDKIIKILVEIGWGLIVFSVDAPDAKTHDFLRGKSGCFKRVLHNIERIQYWKKKLKKQSPQINFQTVILKLNYTKIKEIVELGHNLGVKQILFTPVVPRTRWAKKLKLVEEELKTFQKYTIEAQEIAKKYGITTNLADLTDSRLITETGDSKKVLLSNSKVSTTPCLEPWLSLYISSSGRIGVCEEFTSNTRIGNRSLKEIWSDDEFLNDMRDRSFRKKLPEMCKNCCEDRIMRNKLLIEKIGISFHPRSLNSNN